MVLNDIYVLSYYRRVDMPPESGCTVHWELEIQDVIFTGENITHQDPKEIDETHQVLCRVKCTDEQLAQIKANPRFVVVIDVKTDSMDKPVKNAIRGNIEKKFPELKKVKADADSVGYMTSLISELRKQKKPKDDKLPVQPGNVSPPVR